MKRFILNLISFFSLRVALAYYYVAKKINISEFNDYMHYKNYL
jgi:hypothetical protein